MWNTNAAECWAGCTTSAAGALQRILFLASGAPSRGSVRARSPVPPSGRPTAAASSVSCPRAAPNRPSHQLRLLRPVQLARVNARARPGQQCRFQPVLDKALPHPLDRAHTDPHRLGNPRIRPPGPPSDASACSSPARAPACARPPCPARSCRRAPHAPPPSASPGTASPPPPPTAKSCGRRSALNASEQGWQSTRRIHEFPSSTKWPDNGRIFAQERGSVRDSSEHGKVGDTMLQPTSYLQHPATINQYSMPQNR